MTRYSLSHLSDDVLLRDLATAVAQERTATAEVLAHIAEVDARKLYLPAAYPSMYAYCVGELHYSEQAALKRIRAARAAKRFRTIFGAVAGGRLNLSGVVLLAPYLTEDTAEELLRLATHKSKPEIEHLLAERFPRSDVLTWIAPTPPAPSGEEHAPAHVELSPGTVESVHEVHRVTPMSAQSYAVQFTMSRRGHDDLRYAQALLGHRVSSGDLAQVFERALKALIPQLEKQKFAATDRPHQGGGRPSANPRHISAHVRRAVWERDQGRCTFVSDHGHRCSAETDLEFDHVLEVARGGEATVAGIRLRCRAHNQYGAERTFGTEFMRHKRLAAAETRAAAKGTQAQAAPTQSQTRAANQGPSEPDEQDVVPWLRALGFNAAEARRAAERCADMHGASIEERVRTALTCFRVRAARVVRAAQDREGAASTA